MFCDKNIYAIINSYRLELERYERFSQSDYLLVHEQRWRPWRIVCVLNDVVCIQELEAIDYRFRCKLITLHDVFNKSNIQIPHIEEAWWPIVWADGFSMYNNET